MLAHDAYGAEGSPRILLIHGWPLNRGIWSEVAPRLADAGFRVICPDLPGFGESPPLPTDRWTVEAFADEVAEFVRHGGTDRVAVAGHSFGGYVVLALAERGCGVMAGLGLVASRTRADSDAARAGRHATIEKVRAQGSRALLPDLPPKLVASTAADDLHARAQRAILACPPEAVLAGLAAMAARPDRTAVLESLPRPLLVLHGDADQLIPVVEAALPARQAGPMDRVILPGVGHMPMWESPGRTADAIRAWAQSAHGL
jgi:pimeloyl-ACP methyl ester carboxylesterase